MERQSKGTKKGAPPEAGAQHVPVSLYSCVQSSREMRRVKSTWVHHNPTTLYRPAAYTRLQAPPHSNSHLNSIRNLKGVYLPGQLSHPTPSLGGESLNANAEGLCLRKSRKAPIMDKGPLRVCFGHRNRIWALV